MITGTLISLLGLASVFITPEPFVGFIFTLFGLLTVYIGYRAKKGKHFIKFEPEDDEFDDD